MSKAATRKPYPMRVRGGTITVLAYSKEDAARRLANASRFNLQRVVQQGVRRKWPLSG